MLLPSVVKLTQVKQGVFQTRSRPLRSLFPQRAVDATGPLSSSLETFCGQHALPSTMSLIDAGSPVHRAEHRVEHRRGRPAAAPAEPADGSGRMRPLRYAMPTRSCKSLDAAGAAEGAACASCRCWGARER